ncbi:MAG: helix-turn-helix domain-containing protein [Clostridia bacterium]
MQDISLNRSSYLAGSLMAEGKTQEEACYVSKLYNVSNVNTLAYLLYMLEGAAEDYNRKGECYKSLASSKLTELIIRVAREYIDPKPGKAKASYPKAFIKCQALLDYLNNEYHRKINSQDIQQRFGANYAYLNRVFHRMTGHTIMNYLNLVRVKKAAELVESTDINFSEIGYLVGIDDPYYLSKIFKKYTGIPPMQYRKNLFANSGQTGSNS